MPNETQQVDQVPTKEVYVYGNVYYDAMEGVEIQVFFDHDITFTVPADMDLEEPSDDLHALVMANAINRVRERLKLGIVLIKARWDADYVVHNVGE